MRFARHGSDAKVVHTVMSRCVEKVCVVPRHGTPRWLLRGNAVAEKKKNKKDRGGR